MAKHSNIKGFFDNVEKRLAERAEDNLRQMLPNIAFIIHGYAKEALKQAKKSSMTGNFINSFGVALYKDGKFVAVGTTHDEEGKSPVRVTLASGETFERWSTRYEGRKQFHAFTAPEGTSHIFANEEVVNWLRRYPPTKKKGFSFRVVSVVDYAKSLGGENVLLRIADDIESAGGIINEFRLG